MSKQDATHVLRFGGGLTVPVPGDLNGEDAALAAHPGFQARMARARANMDAGRGIPEEEVDRYLAELEAREYSGSLRVRMPKHLHRDLAQQAERDGVSLNTLIIALLERGIGAIGAIGGPSPSPAPPR
jgi:hypothetical protein